MKKSNLIGLGVLALLFSASAQAADFDTHLPKAETDALNELVSNCDTPECFKNYSDDFFSRSGANLNVAIQGIPKTLQKELNLGGCYKKKAYATQMISCERQIIDVVQNQIDGIDTSQSMLGVVMPEAVRKLAADTCMQGNNSPDEALKNPKVDQCVRNAVVALQKRMTDAKQIASAADVQNRRAMNVNKLCKVAGAKAKKAGKAFDTSQCQAAESQADLLALKINDALTGPEIDLASDIAVGAPGIKSPGQQAKDSTIDKLYGGDVKGFDGGVHCPYFIPHVFCGDGKYDPRKYKKEGRNDTGVFVYDEKAAIPEGLANVRELMGPVYNGALRGQFEKDLAEHTAKRAIEKALQTAALTMDTSDFNNTVDELADTAACLPSYRDSDKVKKLAAALPISKNTSSPKTVQAQTDYKANMAIAAQCISAISNRTQRLRGYLGLNLKPAGSWIDAQEMKKSYGAVGGFLAEAAVGFVPIVGTLVFQDGLYISNTDLTKAYCSMLNQRQSLERFNECRDIQYEFALMTNELNVNFNKYTQLGESQDGAAGFESIVKAGGVDPRIASYDLDPTRRRDADNAMSDENGDLIFCMDRAKRLGIVPNQKALDAASRLVKGTVDKQIDGFKQAIKQACDDPETVANDSIQDPAMMEGFFNCNRPRFEQVGQAMGSTPAELIKMRDSLSKTDCDDRQSSSPTACYFYRQVEAKKARGEELGHAAVTAATLGQEAVGIAGFGSMASAVVRGSVTKILDKMGTMAVKDVLLDGGKIVAKAGFSGAAFGAGMAGMQMGEQYAAGNTESDIKKRADAEQLKIRSGTGNYEAMVAAQRALEEASKSHPIVEAALKGAAMGVLFGVALAPFEAVGPNEPLRAGQFSPETLQAAREKFPQLWVDLEQGGAFKDPKLAKQLDVGLRPMMKWLLAQSDVKETPAAIEKMPTRKIVRRLRAFLAKSKGRPGEESRQVAGNSDAGTVSVAEGEGPSLLDLEGVAQYDKKATGAFPLLNLGYADAAKRILLEADPKAEIPTDPEALIAKAQEVSKKRLEEIQKSLGDLRNEDIEAANIVDGSPELKLTSEEALAIYKRLLEKGNSRESIRKLFERLARECPVGPAAIAQAFKEAGVLFL